ncbi:MAG: T9SS type A sorting domain-containing protein [Bacteroidetes bacterium]|nr:T9SS type A sorting domain-containing protein [Bacteroidota bacterium]
MKKIFLILVLFIYSNSFSQWSRANAGVDGGVIFSIYAMPSSNTLYCGSNGSGVFKSTNAGDNWAPVNIGISEYGFYPTCFASVGSTVFMGASYSASNGGGMYRTTDGAATWQKINSGLNGKALDINKSTTRNSDVFITTDSGVYRSTNNGSNWVHLTASINPVPKADGIFFKGDTLYIGTNQGVFYSTGNYSSWTSATAGSPGGPATSFAYYNGNLYSTFFGSGVFVSSNNGANWSAANYNLTGNLLNLRCVYVFNNSLYVSCNGGVFMLGSNTWNSMSTGLPTDYPYFYWLTSVPGKLITCTYAKGVYVSSNNGASWNQKISGLTSGYVNAKKIIASGNILYAATSNNGVYKSTDNGINWFTVNNGNSLACNNICSIDSRLYALSDGGVFYTTDGGSSWTSLNNGLSGNDLKVYSIMKSGATLFIGTYNGIFNSTNDGQTWIANSFHGTQKLVVTMNQINGVLFAGCSPSTPSLSKSTDGGNTWSTVAYFSFQAEVFDIYIDGTSIYLGTGHGVHRSTNNGLNWTVLNNGLGADPYVSSIIRVGSALFCTQMFGGRGLFRSYDNGANWVDVTGLYFIFSDFNDVINFNNNIFVATSSAIYYQPQSQLTSVRGMSGTVSSFSLQQNYPNPFNPATTIKYSIKQNEFVTLNVFDLAGRIVSTLINDYKTAGEYSINFNAANLPSGIYFYTLKAGDFSETRKMILMK